MKKEQKTDFIFATLLMLTGVGLIVCPLFNFTNIKLIFSIVMGIYALANLGLFIINYKSKDFEGLLTFFASIAAGVCNYIYYDGKYPVILSLSVILWIMMMSIVKLNKADYYNDKKDRMWKLMVFLLIMFLIIGLVTAISLSNNDVTTTIVLGYFFFIHGLFEMIDPLVKYLIKS